ncbi:MAG: hypothetical protein JWM72_442 [Actinomycetia bacterium]|nr:hypothetical protein [Actinomycetes bacterium]MDQ1460528.1 hypothetical protein [Actinomycetota bacterium]
MRTPDNALAHADIAADCAAAFYADHFVSQGAVTATPTDAMGTPTGPALLVPTPLGRKPTARRGRRRA